MGRLERLREEYLVYTLEELRSSSACNEANDAWHSSLFSSSRKPSHLQFVVGYPLVSYAVDRKQMFWQQAEGVEDEAAPSTGAQPGAH